MSIFRRRQGSTHPYHLFGPSIGGLLTFGAIFGGAYFLWPMLGIDTHPYVKDRVTSSTTVGYDGVAVARGALPTTLTVTKIRSVYDGDTFRVESRELVSHDDKGIPVRIRDIDAAEINGGCRREILLAKTARQWLVERLNQASSISLQNISYDEDPHGRVVAEVFVDGKPLAAQMIAAGAAVAWKDGQKPTWCQRA